MTAHVLIEPAPNRLPIWRLHPTLEPIGQRWREWAIAIIDRTPAPRHALAFGYVLAAFAPDLIAGATSLRQVAHWSGLDLPAAHGLLRELVEAGAVTIDRVPGEPPVITLKMPQPLKEVPLCP